VNVLKRSRFSKICLVPVKNGLICEFLEIRTNYLGYVRQT